MFVMIGALGVNLITFHYILHRDKPVCCDANFGVPKVSKVDMKLVVGAAIFGLGWGFAGLCPGPGMIDFFTTSYVYYWIIGLAVG